MLAFFWATAVPWINIRAVTAKATSFFIYPKVFIICIQEVFYLRNTRYFSFISIG